MDVSDALPMDVESSKSQVHEPVQSSEGLPMNPQTGMLNLNGSTGGVNDSTPPSLKLVNGVHSLPPSSASFNVDPSPSPSSAIASTQHPSYDLTQMMNTNGQPSANSLGAHGSSSSTGMLDLYKSPHTEGGLNSGKHFQYSTFASFSDPQVVINTMPAGAVHPPVPNQYVHPHTYVPGTALPPVPSPAIPFPSAATQHAAKNAFHRAPVLVPDSQHANPVPVQNSFSSNAVASPTPNVRPGAAWTSATPGNPVTGNAIGQHHMFTAHSMPIAPMGHWLQTSHSSALPRPQYLPYPSNPPAPFPGIPHPSVPFSATQPPRLNPAVHPSGPPMSSSTLGLEVRSDSGMMLDLPPGTDGDKIVSDIKKTTADTELSNAWTSHKTEAGVTYYYNALSGESTYERPPGLKELSMVTSQPTPTSWVKVAGTDWVSVTTSDGKNYYYNSNTKLSSWQIPPEVVEVRRKQDVEISKEHSLVVLSDTPSIEKQSGPPRLDTPAIDTENHDAASSKSVILPTLPSALDSIKKKLQESTTLENISLLPIATVLDTSDLNGSKGGESILQDESNKEKPKDASVNDNVADSSSDSDDLDSGPTKEQCIIQFKEMLKERGVAPFSKWEKELPKLVFDPRFKAIPSHSMRRSLFDHYVKTRAEEERKEKRAAQKAALDGFKQLLQDATEDIDHNTDYDTFKGKWGDDARFKALNRKDREALLNERIIPLRKAAEEKAQAIRAEAATFFKSMLRERKDINMKTRWSKVKDSLRNDPRYKSVKHEDREVLFNEYIADLKTAEEEEERGAKSKRQEQEKLRERERELRKRKEREEEEIERMRLKVRRKEAVSSYQALLVEVIKDPQVTLSLFNLSSFSSSHQFLFFIAWTVTLEHVSYIVEMPLTLTLRCTLLPSSIRN
uniref:Pre-mRNA-processing protein 40C n=1 Tax=Kalanchoe fedtschenkoi TaxID=63787 RepID=A0A7N1A2Y7_KALFE